MGGTLSTQNTQNHNGSRLIPTEFSHKANILNPVNPTAELNNESQLSTNTEEEIFYDCNDEEIVGNQDNQDIQNTQETQEKIDDYCTVCHEDYDNDDHRKVELCAAQKVSHFVCKSCIAGLKLHDTTACPMCREFIFQKLELEFYRLYLAAKNL